MADDITEIRPQPKQESFLATAADIAIYGGGAGAGKSFSLLLEPLRHVTTNPDFYAVMFRRTTPQIRNPGGLWDESAKLYPLAGGNPVQTILEWKWNGGGRVKMAHLEHDKTVYDWQGSQIPLLCCEENTLIRISNTECKRLKDIVIGDYVMTLQGPRKVTGISKAEEKECVSVTLPNGKSQIHSADHPVLTKGGWISYDDIVCESHLSLDKEKSTLHQPLRIFSQLFDKTRQFLQQCLEYSYSYLLHKKVFFESLLGCLSLSGIFVCKGELNQDKGSLLSLCGILKFLRHVLILPLQELKILYPLLLAISLMKVSLRRVFSYAPSVCKQASCLKNYLSCIHLYDALVLKQSKICQDSSLQLVCAVAQIQKDSLSDDGGITQKHNRHKLRYVHPYTGQARESIIPVDFVSAQVSPIGIKNVIHLTIESENHYITESGLINKNCFDEITHFTEAQFFYMLSRNRSMCGVKPYVRATCNPDADSWVAQFISWWIDHNGFAIPERSGALRWFVRVKGEIKWADTKEECIKLHGFANLDLDDPAQVQPKSVTFISASLDDNQALVKADPGYRSNLLALDIVSQARLLHGNWKIKWDSGMEIFREESLLVDGLPIEMPTNGDYVYCTIDSAMKDGSKNDGTAAVYWLRSKYLGSPLTILDWEFFQMEGSLLEFWLPSVFDRLNELAAQCHARHGSLGAFIEDKSSGTVLLQQAKRKGLPATAIDGTLTAIGKSPRAISVSGYVHRGNVKIAKEAYTKVVTYKGQAKNYLLHNVTSFRVGIDNKEDDTTDAFTYGVAVGLGNDDGF